jgi:ABC-type multidrug transport system fused ATPase/permease subunit
MTDRNLCTEQGELVLDVSGVSFSYGARKILDDISFSIEPGQSVAVMGKTTSRPAR